MSKVSVIKNKINKKPIFTLRLVLVVLYFVNLFLLYHFASETIMPGNEVGGISYLWAWGTISMAFLINPELNILFPSQKKKEKEKPEDTIFTLMFRFFLLMGIILAPILLVYTDLKLLI